MDQSVFFKGNFECWFLLLHKPALDLHSALWLLTAKEELTGCGTSRPTETTCFWRLARWMCFYFLKAAYDKIIRFCCIDNLSYRCSIALVEDVFSSSLQSCDQQIFQLFTD